MNATEAIDVVQGSQEWLDARRQGIGASDVAAIMGLSPFKGPGDVWSDKVHGQRQLEGPAIDWGHAHEAEARRDFAVRYGLTVDVVGMVVSKDRPYMRVSPDGMIGTDALLEIKCPYSQDLPTTPDFHYFIQCQYQMLVTGRPLCYLHYWVPDGHRTFTLEADAQMQARIQAEVEAFWKLVEAKTPPAKDWEELRLDNDAPEVYEYADIKRSIDKLEERKHAIEEVWKEKAAGKRLVMPSLTYSPVWRETRDYKGACERNHIDVGEGKRSLSYRATLKKGVA